MKNKVRGIVILLILMFSNHLVAQDTIRFNYDADKQQLIIITNKFTWGFSRDQINGNTTIQELSEALDGKRNSFFMELPSSLGSKYDGDTAIVDIKSFDSTQIANLTIYETNAKYELIKNKELEKDIKVVHKQIDERDGTDEKNNNINLFLLAGLTILLLIGVCLIIFSKRKKKTIETPKTPPRPEEKKDLSIKIVKPQISSTRIIGLEHVREHENEYYLLDIQQQFADTAIHKIYFHHTAVKKTYDFFKTFLESADRTPETGCYLVGCREYADESHKTYNISVEDIVEPGDDIKPDEYSFSFGYKIGSYLDMKLRNLREKTGRDYVHTVWMHSHPGIGLFLSSQDLVVQKLLKNSKEPGRLAAFVIDTNTPHWDFSVFSAQMDGEMNTQTDKTYSLDELYSWCRRVHAQDDDKNLDDYLNIDLNSNNNGLSHLYISGKVINRMEEVVYDAGKECKVAGYLSGTVNTSENWCRIDECVKTSNACIGIMIVDNETPYERLFMKYEDTLQESLVIVVYRSDEEIWLCTRTDTNGQFNTQDGITQYSLNQMRDWMRRKRIYK